MIPYEHLSEKTQQILLRKAKSSGRLPAECLDIFEGQILYLVDAINALPGLVSNESCGGHPEKLLLPFVNFTLLEPAAAQRDLAYVIKGAYLSNWQVLCNCSRPGSAEGIYYSYLLLPRMGHASDTEPDIRLSTSHFQQELYTLYRRYPPYPQHAGLHWLRTRPVFRVGRSWAGHRQHFALDAEVIP